MGFFIRLRDRWRDYNPFPAPPKPGPLKPPEPWPPAPPREPILSIRALRAAMPRASSANVLRYQPHLDASARAHGIDTPLRLAHWLAQIAHESGSLHYVEEIASGTAYEGRRDLGNVKPGDGVRFKGRGLIQLTGRANYERYAKDTGHPVDLEPSKLADHAFLAADVAGWFWATNNCNRWADLDDLRAVSGIVNAGNPRAAKINGLADRMARLIEAKKGLGL